MEKLLVTGGSGFLENESKKNIMLSHRVMQKWRSQI